MESPANRFQVNFFVQPEDYMSLGRGPFRMIGMTIAFTLSFADSI
jgi:hypothetical protein